MNESLISKIVVGIIVGVAGTVISAVALDYIKQSPSNEPIERKSVSRNVDSPSNSGDNQSARQNPGVSTPPNTQNYYPAPKIAEENYSSYINSKNRSNVSVIIVDANGNLSNSASDAIAGVYQKAGKNTSIGLIKSAFVGKPAFQELREGNSEIIQKLNLAAYADHVAVGKINFTYRAGSLVDGTIVCTASISMGIISTSSKSLEKSFAISNASGNGATEDQAKEDAFQKLLDKYYKEHSSL